jgi:hypothetical protein
MLARSRVRANRTGRATLEEFAKLWLDLAHEREHALLEKWGEMPAPISAIYPTALR